MKRFFKLLINILGLICFMAVVTFTIFYIDEHNLTSAIRQSPSATMQQSIDGIKSSIDQLHEGSYGSDIGHPRDTRPIFVDISSSNTKDEEFRYIYPTQIYYATTNAIKFAFGSEVLEIPNDWGLNGLWSRLQGASIDEDFIYMNEYIINKAAVIAVGKEFDAAYNHNFYIKLINKDETIYISKAKYKEIKKGMTIETN